MKRIFAAIYQNPVWAKVILFNLSLFLIWLADGIVAFWAPVQIEKALNNSVIMGIIISFQSVAGLLADVSFPIILKKTSVKKLIIFGIIFVVAASLLLTISTFRPFVVIFLITMVIWGVYYEFISFANNQFVANSVPSHMRSGAWGITSVFANTAYFIGPLIAPFLLDRSSILTEVFVLVFLVISFILLGLNKIEEKNEDIVELKDLSPIQEFKHWLILSKVLWPMIVITLALGFIDSTFWTIGAIWSEKLSHITPLGAMFLPLYMMPAIAIGFFMAKEGIYKGKKILSEKILIVAGICLFLMAFNSSVYWQLGMVFLASICFACIGPLVSSVYTDIVSRMGHTKKEMIGLTNSIVNVAYIIWPPVIGFISLQIGERLAFSYLGFLAVLVSIGLLFATPKKFRLPQNQIRDWE